MLQRPCALASPFSWKPPWNGLRPGRVTLNQKTAEPCSFRHRRGDSRLVRPEKAAEPFVCAVARRSYFPYEQSLDGFACLICLFVLGCATHAPTTNANMWRIQKERRQPVAREFGRIGYIGNSGPAVGGGFP